MDFEQRKSEIRRRLTAAQNPRRAQAQFNAENDHNPIVLQDCPKCYGTGITCEHRSPDVIAQIECSTCSGDGITGKTETFFNNDAPPMGATPNEHGWIKCPNCGTSFMHTDRNAWTGQRHMKCGQKITINLNGNTSPDAIAE